MKQRLVQGCFAAIMVFFLSTSAFSEEKKTPPADASPPHDVFLKKGTSTGVTVDFDCGNGRQQSQYCLIALNDKENGVVCYGLVSNDKVVNPSMNCVSVGQKNKK